MRRAKQDGTKMRKGEKTESVIVIAVAAAVREKGQKKGILGPHEEVYFSQGRKIKVKSYSTQSLEGKGGFWGEACRARSCSSH